MFVSPEDLGALELHPDRLLGLRQDVEVDEVEACLEELRGSRRSKLALDLRQRVAAERQDLALGREHLAHEVDPRAPGQRGAQRHGIQEETQDAVRVSGFRPAVRHQAGGHVPGTRDPPHDPDVGGEKHVLEGHARAARQLRAAPRHSARQRYDDERTVLVLLAGVPRQQACGLRVAQPVHPELPRLLRLQDLALQGDELTEGAAGGGGRAVPSSPARRVGTAPPS